MKKRLLFFCFLLLISTSGFADEVNFTASSPATVVNGQVFRLSYSVNASARDFRAPEISDFEILAGPFESRSQNVQFINGQMSSSVNLSFTYTLQAKKEGTFTIAPASIIVDKQKYTSNSITIKVLPVDQQAVPQQQSANQSRSEQNNSSSQNVSNEQIFVQSQVSRTKVFEQDYLLVTYKLYSLVDVVGYTMKLPDFKGFLKQEIELPKDKQLTLENYKGRNYSTIVLYQALLFPQRSGTIDIEKANFEMIIRLRNTTRVRSLFDDFFDTYQDVKKTLTTNSIKINVEALPKNKPSSFSGAVGSFNLTSDISSTSVNQNDAVTLKINISGNGNMKLIKTPDVKFPADFEVYDPKIDNSFKTTATGVSGKKTFEYLIIPRSSGRFVIPSVQFTYFDVASKTYNTLQTKEYEITVRKGSGDNTQSVLTNYSDKETLKVLGKDIRYIYTDKIKLHKKNDFILKQPLFFLLYLFPLLAVIFIFIVYRKKIKENADVFLVRNKKANKLAKKRLKIAQKYYLKNEQEDFYDEVLKALWGYMSDKLSIPVASLSKDNVESELQKHEVDKETISEFMQLLSICEFARYAPAQGIGAMDEVYQKSITLISKLQESIIK